KKPILAVVQEVAGKVWLKNEFPFPFNFILGLIGYLSEPFIFMLYKNIQFMTGSNSAKESLVKVGIPAKNITIIPHGVLVVRPKPIPKKEKTKTVIFLGAISRDKGIEDVLLTFASLNKMGNYKFWLVGRASDMYLKSIKNTSEKLGFSKNLTYFGFVSQKEKFRLLAKAHVLINPSLLEGWGLVNIVANSMGTPVVAYKSAGLVDSVKNNISGVITKKNTPEDLAVITDKILNNKKKYKALREGALIWSSRFNWKNSRKLSLALIQKIIIK